MGKFFNAVFRDINFPMRRPTIAKPVTEEVVVEPKRIPYVKDSDKATATDEGWKSSEAAS